MERVGVGMLGCGRIADLQCLGYLEHPRAKIVAVCDLDGEMALIETTGATSGSWGESTT